MSFISPMFWNFSSPYVVLAFLFLLAFLFKQRKTHLAYPPGPLARFITGNVADIPPHHAWLGYTDWMQQYGPIVHIRAFTQHIIVLNTVEAATELLTRRSLIYSDRPYIPMLDLTGWDFNFAFLTRGDMWRKCRTLSHQAFKPNSIAEYRSIQVTKVHDYIRGLLSSPEKWMDHNRNLSTSVTMKILYGYDISPKEDYFVSIAEEATLKFCEAVLPGAYIVNAVPILRYLPTWFPFIKFHQHAAETRVTAEAMQTKPVQFVKDNMKAGTGRQCLVRKSLEEGVDDEVIRKVGGTAYAGGSDTTVAAMGTFILSMIKNPRVVSAAQEELNRVVGKDRLPTFDDELPYIEAIVREIMRIHPVVPLGLPHANSNEDVYQGYYIPKDCIILPNVWAMSRDETKYPNPEEFIPERFLNPNGTLTDDDVSFTFGFGRRICVGRYLALETMWLAMASFLHTFNISTAKDDEGKEIPIAVTYSDGLISQPDNFKCAITPRSEQAIAFVNM
ncbi:cytochrome P450 [Mycena floridula]|nr:cytochrome P450 [Mycena floridula]